MGTIVFPICNVAGPGNTEPRPLASAAKDGDTSYACYRGSLSTDIRRTDMQAATELGLGRPYLMLPYIAMTTTTNMEHSPSDRRIDRNVCKKKGGHLNNTCMCLAERTSK